MNLYSYFRIAPTYTSVAKMYIVSASDDSVVDLTDLNIGKALTLDYEDLMLSYPVLDQVGVILERYAEGTIEIEGHTDNVPMSSARYANNNELSDARALSVFDYLVAHTALNPANIKHSGRGEYVPVADNSTEEGRAKNRRVEIRIYNSYSSY